MAVFLFNFGGTATPSAPAKETYPALNAWPLETFLRKSVDDGGCNAFYFVGDDTHPEGNYRNPSAGIAATATFIPPQLTSGNVIENPDTGEAFMTTATGNQLQFTGGKNG